MSYTIIINLLSGFPLLSATPFVLIKLLGSVKKKRELLEAAEMKYPVMLKRFTFGMLVGIIGMAACLGFCIYGIVKGIIESSFTDLFLGIVWGIVCLAWLVVVIVLWLVFRYTWITDRGVIMTEQCSVSMIRPDYFCWTVKGRTLRLGGKNDKVLQSYRIMGDANEAVYLLSIYYEELK